MYAGLRTATQNVLDDGKDSHEDIDALFVATLWKNFLTAARESRANATFEFAQLSAEQFEKHRHELACQDIHLVTKKAWYTVKNHQVLSDEQFEKYHDDLEAHGIEVAQTTMYTAWNDQLLARHLEKTEQKYK